MSNFDTNGTEVPEQDENTDSASLRVILTLADRTTLLDLMDLLDQAEIPVQTEDISRLGFEEPETVTLNLGELTDKQRDTIRIALQTGYYEQPREADLADLSERIGVSKSAISQRLRTAESKLIKHAFCEYR